MINTRRFLNTVLKTSDNIFKDLLIPVNKRTSFIKNQSPFIPVYFYRYIGINKEEEKYYNGLYKLDESLSKFGDSYIKFTSHIPVISNPELVNKTSGLWQNLNPFNDSQKKVLITSFRNVKVFDITQSSLINSSIDESFHYILDLYIENEQNINLTKIKNFSLKLLSWVYKFVPTLFRNIDYKNNSTIDIYNPKVVFYGSIKKHEIYFLIFLSKISCDVLYINSFSDDDFSIIKSKEDYSKILESPKKSPMKPFPEKELLARKETVAFQASQEITDILYNNTDGLYKPWQFENYKTQPLTLKTTFDELKILWNEESRMRSGFKIENNTVYIPNLFAKISGIHDDINIFWNEVKDFKSTENTLFISSVPFTKITYSKPELYSCSFLFNQNGLIDKDKVLTHKLYRFSYLKSSLQNIILDKINYLIKISMLKKPIDKEFRLKILITVLTMDKKILELIQRFDYPFKLPKIIVYDNDENLFSDEDSIILSFLNLIGFDILILTPTGYNNIEQQIYTKFFDTHKLETIKFNLELPNFNMIRNGSKKKSFWSNLFN